MLPSFNTIELKLDDTTASILLNRPEKRNALSLAMIEEIATAFDYCNNQETVAVILLKSNLSTIFSAGIDINDLSQQISNREPEELPDLVTTIQDQYHRIANSVKPTIASIDGLCLGAGVELILCCDFRIATSQAVFAINEVKYGLIPDLGGISRLVRLTSVQTAKRLVMLGQQFSSEDALNYGVIDWLTDQPDRQVEELITTLQSNSALAVQHAKQSLNQSLDHDLSAALQQDGVHQLQLIESGEPIRLLRQFLHRKDS